MRTRTWLYCKWRDRLVVSAMSAFYLCGACTGGSVSSPSGVFAPIVMVVRMTRATPIFFAQGIHLWDIHRNWITPVLGCIRNRVGKCSAASSITAPNAKMSVNKISRCRYKSESATNKALIVLSRASVNSAIDGCTGCPRIFRGNQGVYDGLMLYVIPALVVIAIILALFGDNIGRL
jgi:hypothetical protein